MQYIKYNKKIWKTSQFPTKSTGQYLVSLSLVLHHKIGNVFIVLYRRFSTFLCIALYHSYFFISLNSLNRSYWLTNHNYLYCLC